MNSLIQNDDEPYIKQNKVAFDSTCLHSRKTHLSSVIQSLQHESNAGCIKLFLQCSNKNRKSLWCDILPCVWASYRRPWKEKRSVTSVAACCTLVLHLLDYPAHQKNTAELKKTHSHSWDVMTRRKTDKKKIPARPAVHHLRRKLKKDKGVEVSSARLRYLCSDSLLPLWDAHV